MAQQEPPIELFDATGKPVTRTPDAVHVTTNGVVFNAQNDVLMQRRADNGWWGLPGGYLDAGESVEQGAIREVWEETGLRTTTKRLVGIYSDPRNNNLNVYPEGNIVQFVTIVFECLWRSGELKISDESTDIGYFSINQLPENTLVTHRVRIQDALANRIEPFLR